MIYFAAAIKNHCSLGGNTLNLYKAALMITVVKSIVQININLTERSGAVCILNMRSHLTLLSKIQPVQFESGVVLGIKNQFQFQNQILQVWYQELVKFQFGLWIPVCFLDGKKALLKNLFIFESLKRLNTDSSSN